jgi:hypothetical protein
LSLGIAVSLLVFLKFVEDAACYVVVYEPLAFQNTIMVPCLWLSQNGNSDRNQILSTNARALTQALVVADTVRLSAVCLPSFSFYRNCCPVNRLHNDLVRWTGNGQVSILSLLEASILPSLKLITIVFSVLEIVFLLTTALNWFRCYFPNLSQSFVYGSNGSQASVLEPVKFVSHARRCNLCVFDRLLIPFQLFADGARRRI